MLCSFSHSLSLLLCTCLLCFPYVPITNAHHAKKPQPNNTLQQTNMLPSEAETLFKIMDSMSTDQAWRVSYPTPCKPSSAWPGLECKLGDDNHFHVSRLDFGISPNPTCKINATFPFLVFSLAYLQSVFFFNCFTHTNTTLSVSPNRLLNSSLQQLSLRSNPSLLGSIPPQISSLKSLQILTLSQNRLTGKIPVEIFSLNSLLHLDLSYNMLMGTIPDQIGNLKRLVGLDLSYNSLSGTVPPTIGHLGMLQKIDLSSNLLTGSIPDTIENLNSLVFVALSNNRLQGNFPEGLAKLQNLQYFIMDDNPMFIPLPDDFGKLVKLQELRLADSGYSGAIPPSFSKMKNLSSLSLQNNNLTGEIPASFADLSSIYHLNLSRNSMTGLIPFDTHFLTRLGRNLDLSGNPGLCLNPAEAYSVKMGVPFCARNKNCSLIIPLNPFIFLGVLVVLGFYQMF